MTKTFNTSSTRLLDPITSDLKPICFSQQDAFTCLYDAYVDRIYRYIYLRMADSDLAENITSQVFLEAWEQLPAYKTGKSPIISWLYSIAYHAVINHGCTHENLIAPCNTSLAEISHEDDIVEKPGSQIKSQQLSEPLEESADKQQQVLILKFVHEINTPGMLGQLEKQQGTIRSLQMRGLAESSEYLDLQMEQIYEQ
jgi:RNA polymerase sigma-70 factor (ECF subfamily)